MTALALAPAALDIDACRAILREGSGSFATAARILPRRVREPASIFYAFCLSHMRRKLG